MLSDNGAEPTLWRLLCLLRLTANLLVVFPISLLAGKSESRFLVSLYHCTMHFKHSPINITVFG